MKSFALVFPGQGSQSVGMIDDLADQFSVVKHTFEEASDALGEDLLRLARSGPKETLDLTTNTQPVVLTAGIATYRVWQALDGPDAKMLAGHSLGEYSALVAAGSMTFADAVRLVRIRAEAMQAAVPAGSGAMAAIIGLDDDAVKQVCADTQGVVSPANFNSPGQIVIAGEAASVDAASEAAKAAGAKMAVKLDVSVPSHCELMRPAAQTLAQALTSVEIQAPSTAVIHNADVASYQEPDKITDALVRQLYEPVRWTETIKYCMQQEVEAVIECGPGKVLTGLNRRIERRFPVHSLLDGKSIEAALQFITS